MLTNTTLWRPRTIASTLWKCFNIYFGKSGW